MLWSELFDKLGRQPLTVTQHNKVKAFIYGEAYELDLKIDISGTLYLSPVPRRATDCRPDP